MNNNSDWELFLRFLARTQLQPMHLICFTANEPMPLAVGVATAMVLVCSPSNPITKLISIGYQQRATNNINDRVRIDHTRKAETRRIKKKKTRKDKERQGKTRKDKERDKKRRIVQQTNQNKSKQIKT